MRRARVLGAVDHNLSVDPCGSGARCCRGSCGKLRALSRDQSSVLFFVGKKKGKSRRTEKKLERADDNAACKELLSSAADPRSLRLNIKWSVNLVSRGFLVQNKNLQSTLRK